LGLKKKNDILKNREGKVSPYLKNSGKEKEKKGKGNEWATSSERGGRK